MCAGALNAYTKAAFRRTPLGFKRPLLPFPGVMLEA
jgi:hypothetical protein